MPSLWNQMYPSPPVISTNSSSGTQGASYGDWLFGQMMVAYFAEIVRSGRLASTNMTYNVTPEDKMEIDSAINVAKAICTTVGNTSL